MGLLEGKVIMITGGARGQGRAHAVTSAREGADVVLVDVDQQVDTVSYATADAEDMKTTVSMVESTGRRALAICADVRSQDELDGAVTAAVEEFGKVDSLIANAGIWTQAPFWKLSESEWEAMIGINLTGVWKSAKAVTPHMIERKSGSIVIISSINGIEPGSKRAHYVAAKHGAIGLMKNIALELAPHGIRCNAVSPGAIKTPMTDHQLAWDMYAGHEGGTEADMIKGGYYFHALRGKTFLPPESIADTALYLNSELAAAVTGVTIPVDAGHLLMTGVNHQPVME